jgi:hypothetical protein
LFNLEHPEGPPAEVIEVEESGNDDSEDEDEIQTSNKSGIEELKKLTLIVKVNVPRAHSWGQKVINYYNPCQFFYTFDE